MYCYNCGKKINEHEIEKQHSSLSDYEEVDSNVTVEYICPRCGHLIHSGLTNEDSKQLSRACHAQIQRGNNSFAKGMCMNVLGLILLVISLIFFLLANKPSQGFVLQVNCAEFYVFLVTLVCSVILLGFGISLTIIGSRNKHVYSNLLKDLNNKTFVQ